MSVGVSQEAHVVGYLIGLSSKIERNIKKWPRFEVFSNQNSEIARSRERVFRTLELPQQLVSLPSIDQLCRVELINSIISQGSGG